MSTEPHEITRPDPWNHQWILSGPGVPAEPPIPVALMGLEETGAPNQAHHLLAHWMITYLAHLLVSIRLYRYHEEMQDDVPVRRLTRAKLHIHLAILQFWRGSNAHLVRFVEETAEELAGVAWEARKDQPALSLEFGWLAHCRVVARAITLLAVRERIVGRDDLKSALRMIDLTMSGTLDAESVAIIREHEPVPSDRRPDVIEVYGCPAA